MRAIQFLFGRIGISVMQIFMSEDEPIAGCAQMGIEPDRIRISSTCVRVPMSRPTLSAFDDLRIAHAFDSRWPLAFPPRCQLIEHIVRRRQRRDQPLDLVLIEAPFEVELWIGETSGHSGMLSRPQIAGLFAIKSS